MHTANQSSDNQGGHSEVVTAQVTIDAEAQIVGGQFGGNTRQQAPGGVGPGILQTETFTEMGKDRFNHLSHPAEPALGRERDQAVGRGDQFGAVILPPMTVPKRAGKTSVRHQRTIGWLTAALDRPYPILWRTQLRGARA